jgi:hypothetical protein
VPINNSLEMLAVMHFGGVTLNTTDHFVFGIDVDRQFVAKMALSVLLGPAGIGILLPPFSGFPVGWHGLFEPFGPTTRTFAYWLSSSAMCQLSRSMPPTSGGRLRVMMRIRWRLTAATPAWLAWRLADRMPPLAGGAVTGGRVFAPGGVWQALQRAVSGGWGEIPLFVAIPCSDARRCSQAQT